MLRLSIRTLYEYRKVCWNTMRWCPKQLNSYPKLGVEWLSMNWNECMVVSVVFAVLRAFDSLQHSTSNMTHTLMFLSNELFLPFESTHWNFMNNAKKKKLNDRKKLKLILKVLYCLVKVSQSLTGSIEIGTERVPHIRTEGHEYGRPLYSIFF